MYDERTPSMIRPFLMLQSFPFLSCQKRQRLDAMPMPNHILFPVQAQNAFPHAIILSRSRRSIVTVSIPMTPYRDERRRSRSPPARSQIDTGNLPRQCIARIILLLLLVLQRHFWRKCRRTVAVVVITAARSISNPWAAFVEAAAVLLLLVRIWYRIEVGVIPQRLGDWTDAMS